MKYSPHVLRDLLYVFLNHLGVFWPEKKKSQYCSRGIQVASLLLKLLPTTVFCPCGNDDLRNALTRSFIQTKSLLPAGGYHVLSLVANHARIRESKKEKSKISKKKKG